jgi:hypothetical protein
MITLTVQAGAESGRVIELQPGRYRVGRGEDNDILLAHPSVSTHHCELVASEFGIAVRDLESTNGSFINGERVATGMVHDGETLRLGDLELRARVPEVAIAIPQADLFIEAPGAAFLADGTPACYQHRDTAAVFRCTNCENWWCGECVRQLKRLSGAFLIFCPECSAACVPLPSASDTQKKSFLRRITSVLRREK